MSRGPWYSGPRVQAPRVGLERVPRPGPGYTQPGFSCGKHRPGARRVRALPCSPVWPWASSEPQSPHLQSGSKPACPEESCEVDAGCCRSSAGHAWRLAERGHSNPGPERSKGKPQRKPASCRFPHAHILPVHPTGSMNQPRLGSWVLAGGQHPTQPSRERRLN